MPGQPLYLTGIYNIINGVNCLIILTTAPNDSVVPIHDRMPLMLSHEQVRPWLVDVVPFEDVTADCAAAGGTAPLPRGRKPTAKRLPQRVRKSAGTLTKA